MKMTDTICYEVPLHNNLHKELILAIIPISLKAKLKYYKDLSSLQEFQLDSAYLLLCENEKEYNTFYSKEIQSLFNLCRSSLKMLYISSEISLVINSNLLIRVTFDYNEKQISNQVKFTQEVIEKVLQILISKHN